MIIINVLPPEYRRTDIGINPITLSVAGAVLVNFIFVLIWAYVTFISIPAAKLERSDLLKKKQEVLDIAEEVRERRKDMEKDQGVMDVLTSLLNKKVYWAKTLNDFVALITNPNNRLNTSGFEVSIESFKISEAVSEEQKRSRGKTKGSQVKEGRSFDMVWKPLIMTSNPETMNANIRIFFEEFDPPNNFWDQHNFKNDPDESYTGSKVEIKEDVGKSVAKFELTWRRIVFSRNADDVIEKKLAEKEAQLKKEQN